jgi:hypothetical protein
MTNEIDVAHLELLGQGCGQLGLEEPAPREQRLAEAHAADAGCLEGSVELVMGDPALLQQDRPEHRADLDLEVPVVEARRCGARGEPQSTADQPLVHAGDIGARGRRKDHPTG